MKRYRFSRRSDRRYFARTADRVKAVNLMPYIPRGGIRL